jgi:isopentenyl-diphosphate delta-isomerase
MAHDEVILVNPMDDEVGACGKLDAHRDGRLHRAISVFLFDSEGRWLLQQRHPDKYHSGGLWSNTCCSHPAPGESTEQAAQRRLMEEMGVLCPLEKVFSFVYRHQFDNGLIEHEFDHVFAGRFEGAPNPNRLEAQAWRWVDGDALAGELRAHPEHFTYWFRATHDVVVELLESDRLFRSEGTRPHYTRLAG